MKNQKLETHPYLTTKGLIDQLGLTKKMIKEGDTYPVESGSPIQGQLFAARFHQEQNTKNAKVIHTIPAIGTSFGDTLTRFSKRPCMKSCITTKSELQVLKRRLNS